MIILAIDALEHELVERFNCANLKQQHYGRTDISEFSEPRTMVLWSSFMTGQNKEQEVLIDGQKEMWDKQWKTEETFFRRYNKPRVIDLPGYSYDLDAHKRSRELLKQFFETKDTADKERIRKAYNEDAFKHHRKVKQQYLEALQAGHDLVLGYFSVIDVIGHLNFGNTVLMRMLYREMDELAGSITDKKQLVLSDHGMKAIGMFGDHSSYGFWSTNWADLGTPKITDFRRILDGISG